MQSAARIPTFAPGGTSHMEKPSRDLRVLITGGGRLIGSHLAEATGNAGARPSP